MILLKLKLCLVVCIAVFGKFYDRIDLNINSELQMLSMVGFAEFYERYSM